MTKSKKKAKKKKSAKKKQPSIPSAAAQSTDGSKSQQPKVTPYPAAGPKVKVFEEKLDEQMGDKPRRGRPPKPPEPEPVKVPSEIVRQAVQVPFDMWAISQNLKGLKLAEKEAAMLAEPAIILLDYYLPQMPVIVIAWASLVISVYAVMKPRLEMIAEIKKEKASPSSESAGKDGGQGSPAPPISPAGQGGQSFPTAAEIKTKTTK